MVSIVCQQTDSDLLELEVMPDHVHLLVDVHPQFGINRLIKRLKGATSRELRKRHLSCRRLPSLWTNSTFVSTVGGAPIQIVKQYIENQKHA